MLEPHSRGVPSASLVRLLQFLRVHKMLRVTPAIESKLTDVLSARRTFHFVHGFSPAPLLCNALPVTFSNRAMSAGE